MDSNWFMQKMDSPLGQLILVSSDTAVKEIRFPTSAGYGPLSPAWKKGGAINGQVQAQLEEYFRGKRRAFDLPLEPEGTDFQRRVWKALLRIPYGTTISYGELARRIRKPTASRAVGAANGRNPISIIIPCHRVIGSTGTLTGYGGGLPNKEFLLKLENALPNQAPLFATG